MDINVEKIIQFIWDTIPEHAEAQGEFAQLEKFSNSLIAKLMKDSGEKSIAAQEREAKAHPDYIAHTYALGAAKQKAEMLRWQLELAKMKFDAWRTMEANGRQVDRMLK